MKTFLKVSLFIILLISISCKKSSEQKIKSTTLYENSDVNIDSLEQNYMKWWSYFSYETKPSKDFISINEMEKRISKEEFLVQLKTGKFIPIKLKSNSDTTYYKLHKLSDKANNDISSTLKSEITRYYKYYKMEGKKFPKLNFVDLNGKIYTNENTKGKTILLKCWFIGCKACVEEFPELNGLVSKYKKRDDIIFLNLAFDSEKALEKFLQKKEFHYETVSVNQNYFTNTLKVTTFPTHFIIDKNGTIRKVVNSFDELQLAIKNYDDLK